MPYNSRYSRSGADLPKNVSESTATDLSYDMREKVLKVGSGCCIAAANISNAARFISWMKIWYMRSRPCSTAAMTFSISFSSTTLYRQIMLIGKGGQISSDVPVGVLSVH